MGICGLFIWASLVMAAKPGGSSSRPGDTLPAFLDGLRPARVSLGSRDQKIFVFPEQREREVVESTLTWFGRAHWEVIAVISDNYNAATARQHMSEYVWIAAGPRKNEVVIFSPCGCRGSDKGGTVKTRDECCFSVSMGAAHH